MNDLYDKIFNLQEELDDLKYKLINEEYFNQSFKESVKYCYDNFEIKKIFNIIYQVFKIDFIGFLYKKYNCKLDLIHLSDEQLKNISFEFVDYYLDINKNIINDIVDTSIKNTRYLPFIINSRNKNKIKRLKKNKYKFIYELFDDLKSIILKKFMEYNETKHEDEHEDEDDEDDDYSGSMYENYDFIEDYYINDIFKEIGKTLSIDECYILKVRILNYIYPDNNIKYNEDMSITKIDLYYDFFYNK